MESVYVLAGQRGAGGGQIGENGKGENQGSL